MGCIPMFVRRIVQGWLLGKALAWWRNRNRRGSAGGSDPG